MSHGLVDVAERVWPVLLFLALVQVVADLCDEAGLFDVAAHACARFAGGRRLALFLLFAALATVCTWVLSIDTTAVLLAPIGLTLAAELGLSPLPFAFASIWLANAGSLLLPVSNLTNLLAQSRLGADARAFVAMTWLPQLVVLAVVVAVLVLRHGRALTGWYVVPGRLPSVDRWLFATAALVVLAFGPAVVLGAPPWTVALVGMVVLVAAFAVRRPAAVRVGRLFRLVPWTVVGLAVVLFAVVDLVTGPLEPVLRWLLGSGTSALDLLQVAGATTVLANALDNLPAYLVVEPHVGDPARLVTTLVGVNAGPMILLWGSLANLLWLRICRRRGLEVTARSFALEGLLVVPLAVAAGALAVHLG